MERARSIFALRVHSPCLVALVGIYICRSRSGEFVIVCELVSLLHKGDEGGGGEDRDALDMSDRNGTEQNGRSFNPWMGGMAVGGGVRWRGGLSW